MGIIHQVTNHIYEIDTGIKMPHPVIAYFIMDRHPALIDPGPASAVPALLEALRELGQEPGEIAHVFLTHVHIDHGGGTGKLLEQMPQAKIVVHPQGVPHLIEPSRLISGAQEIFGEDFQQEFGPVLPVPQHQLQAAQDEANFSLGEIELKVIYSPGHAPHHICFSESQSRGLFVGEALGNPLPATSFVLPPVAPPRFDLEAYLRTLGRLKRLNPRVLFYPHSGTIREVEEQFQLIYESLKTCFAILARAIRTGETPQQTAERFRDYVPEEVLGQFELILDAVLTEGVNLLKKKSLLLGSLFMAPGAAE
jgi:glyoxylase-like metal-dependent hydrolase (beta-lactamase superfamily II)